MGRPAAGNPTLQGSPIPALNGPSHRRPNPHSSVRGRQPHGDFCNALPDVGARKGRTAEFRPPDRQELTGTAPWHHHAPRRALRASPHLQTFRPGRLHGQLQAGLPISADRLPVRGGHDREDGLNAEALCGQQGRRDRGALKRHTQARGAPPPLRCHTRGTKPSGPWHTGQGHLVGAGRQVLAERPALPGRAPRLLSHPSPSHRWGPLGGAQARVCSTHKPPAHTDDRAHPGPQTQGTTNPAACRGRQTNTSRPGRSSGME